jgi:hypothetical protein
MIILCLRRLTKVCLLFFILLIPLSVSSRDINLDEIYINNDSSSYKRLINLKLNAYKITKATTIDNRVMFAGWSSGKRLVYVKEYINSDVNYVYEYYPASRIRRRLHKINGAIIHAKLSQNGHFLFLKNLIINGRSIKNQLVIVNLRKNSYHTRRSNTVLTDFTVSFYGDTIFYETERGICQYFPDQRREKLIIPKRQYSHLFSSKNTTLIFPSPMDDKILFINGGGGSYKAYLYHKNNFTKVSGITSAREITWIDNNHFSYRGGYLGNYSVFVYNAITKSNFNLVKRSLNTNITHTPYDNYITFLQDGIISYYYKTNNMLRFMPMEGEDILFSPSGNYFLSLYNRNLFLTSLTSIKQHKRELNQNAREILNQYKIIQADYSVQENSYSRNY